MIISGTTIGIIALIAFLVMIFMGIPVTLSMMTCGTIGAMFVLRTPVAAFSLLSDSVFQIFTSYTMCVAPMFILMGELATESKIGGDLFDCFQKLIGHKKAGLASASQVVCAIFGAICGSTAATGAMMSRIAYPQMKRYQYDDMLAAGSIASGACLASLIPPSMHLITYGIAAGESIGKLLMGGILTGTVLMIIFVVTIQIWAKINPAIAPASEEQATAKEKWIAIRKGGFIEIILVFSLTMGGMFAGWFAPTEGGAVGFASMLIISVLFRRFTPAVLIKSLKNTMIMTGMIYCLMAGANCFGKFFTLTLIPKTLGSFVAELGIPSIAVIAVLTIVYLVLGCFIDGVAMILLTTPIFLPVVEAAGFSSLWFGCYMVVIVGLGAVTPPVGMNCYIVSGVSGAPLDKVFKGSMPFVFAYIVMAILLALVPGIATAIPNALM